MKVAVISDIHGNYDALTAVLKACKQEYVEEYIFLGDYVGYYYDAKKVWDTVKELSTYIIKGNHEDLLMKSETSQIIKDKILKKYGTGHQLASEQLTTLDKKELFSLPKQLSIELNNVKLQLNHGSPWDFEYYLYPDTPSELLNKANSPEYDFVLVGHSHYSFSVQLRDVVLINAGSVGQNRKIGGIANWGLLDLNDKSYCIKSTPYDVKSLAQSVLKNDPNCHYNHAILFRT